MKFNFGDRVEVIDYKVDSERQYFINMVGTVTCVPDKHTSYYAVVVDGAPYAEELLFEEGELEAIIRI
jgi:hypothetical protein